ncbi:uncharacterized protein SPEM3 [Saccopteryx leptura]|uniref:uncharacterized protein SPEM3 n=1 Tax=Saccopteryx leptura TaxID=249018 RepID=UPI00339C3562
MGEQAHYGAPVCSGTNPRKCQDLGDSILLILGSFILLNVGINVVTLLWKHLKSSLRILFHYFFLQDKQPSCTGSHPTCVCGSVDAKNLYSRVSSFFHQRPSFLLQHPKHTDSWIPDTSDEASRCCWMSPKCGHAKAPLDVPWGLWEEGMRGAGEALQAKPSKAQTTFLSRQETSSQFPRMSKLNMVPLCMPQGNKANTAVYDPAPAPAQTQNQSQAQSPARPPEPTPTQAQTPARPPEPTPTQTQSPAWPPEPTPTQTQSPAWPPEPTPTQTQSPAWPPEPTPTQTQSPARPPEPTPTQAVTYSPSHPSEPTPTQAQTPAQTPEPTPIQNQSPAWPSEPTPTQAQTNSPAWPPEPTPTQAQTYSPSHPPEPTPTQAQIHSFLVHTHEHSPTQVHTSAHTLDQAPAQALFCALAHTLGHTLEHITVHTPASSPVHLTYTHAHTLGCGSAPDPPLTFASATTSAPAPAPAPAPVPISASIPAPALVIAPTITPVPALIPTRTPTHRLSTIPSTLTASSQGLATDHVVYDTCKVKQNLFHVCPTQNAGNFRKDLGTLSRPPNGQGPVNSDTAEKTSMQLSGDTASPSTGSILGYLELGNMEWKISDDAKGKSLQPKTFPYCSFHPCNAERGSTDSQPPVYPKFLVYSKDASPFQPCFHSLTSAQNSVCTTPPSCTLSLPVSPRSFVLHQPTNHQAKLSTSIETPTTPPISKSSPSVPSPQFPIPSQFCTISHTPTQPQSPELHESLGLTQYSGLQRMPSPSMVSRISKNLGFTQGPGLYKLPVLTQHPHLCKSPGPSKDSGLHKNPITQDSGSPKSLGPLQDVCTFRSPCLTQPSGLHKNTPFPQNSDNQRSSGFMQDSGVCKSPKTPQETVFHKSQDLSPTTGLPNSPGSQDPGGYKSTDHAPDLGVSQSLGLTQDSGPQKSPRLAKDAEVNKSAGLPQESVLHNSPGLVQTWGLHKGSGLTQDSGDNNRGLTQDSDLHVNPGLTQADKLERRSGLTQDVGIYKSPEHTQDPSFYKCPGTNQDLHLHKDPALTQDSGLCTTQRLTKESSPHKDLCLILNPDLHKNPGLALGTNVSLTAKSTPSLMKSYISKQVPQENAKQHLPWNSDPLSQNICPSKAQVIYNDLQTLSKVPVLIQLQPSSQQAGGQDCVYHSVNIVPPACQNYCQVHPQISWKTHCPKPGTRVGHVVFDARQRQSKVGTDKCEALAPRRLCQEAPSNSVETTE